MQSMVLQPNSANIGLVPVFLNLIVHQNPLRAVKTHIGLQCFWFVRSGWGPWIRISNRFLCAAAESRTALCELYPSNFQLCMIFVPPRDICQWLGLLLVVTPGGFFWHVIVRILLNILHCTGHPSFLATKNYQTPNVHSAELENHQLNGTFRDGKYEGRVTLSLMAAGVCGSCT